MHHTGNYYQFISVSGRNEATTVMNVIWGVNVKGQYRDFCLDLYKSSGGEASLERVCDSTVYLLDAVAPVNGQLEVIQ